ncbi:MAG TPA: nucleotidyltransferase family protein [Vicinamibacterales bacterium]|nr:nucleotidyltransferase family protein [Vicinamibacterales bacterium]HPW20712.1 nucleotidyltransferase family protein [Vicinamibacterales bacterium]
MKAFLMAGGLGERLRPITDRMPKCLVPIRGVPLLGIWLDLLAREGVDEALVNVSRFPELVEAFLDSRAARQPVVRLVRERSPAGSAGTVAAHRAFVDGEESFWIVYADNLTNASLSRLLAAHRANDGVATLALFRTPSPRSSGIVGVEPDGRIVRFREKPDHPEGNLANAGIYLARQAIFDWIPAGQGVTDFGHDVFPRMVGRMYGYEVDGYLIDIGTPERLEQANADWPGF